MNAPDRGQINLFENCQPPLDAGDYRLTLEHRMHFASGEDASIEKVEQFFRIDGPRFALPPSEVHSVSPPNGSDGSCQNLLPHITLGRRTLPWERSPGTGAAQADPWLALLLVTDDEARKLPVIRTDVPQLGALSGDVSAQPCRMLEMPLGFFRSIAPRMDELKLLCHARQVNTDDKTLLGMDEDGWFSVVVSNRLPTPGAVNHAYLVSLEGLLPFLPEGSAPSTEGASIRLAVLHDWAFKCEGSLDFEGRMRQLDVGMLGAAAADGGGTVVGHVELEMQTLEGETTKAWYRGPFVPVPTTPDVYGPYFVADQARRIDPGTGEENLGYAAAFELGRLLALSDVRFSVALQRWRRDAARQLRASVDEQALKGRLAKYQTAIDPLLEGQPFESLWKLGADPRGLVEGISSVSRKMVQTARATSTAAVPFRWQQAYGPVSLSGYANKAIDVKATDVKATDMKATEVNTATPRRGG